MLDRESIIRIVKDINLPENQYCVTSGAGLVLHGVKEETRDIDLGATTKIVEYFLQQGNKYSISRNCRIVQLDNEVEIIENWIADEINFIDGIPVASLESIKKQKMQLGRAKDFSDVALIEEYMQKKEFND